MKTNKLKYYLLLAAIIFGSINLNAQSTQTYRKNPDSWVPKMNFPSTLPTKALATVIKQDFVLTLRDGVSLDATKFYPSEPNPYLPNGYPCVIMIHGYGDRKETLAGFAEAQASYGYVVYTYSVRGQGNSGGLSNLISMTEAQDLIEFVNFVRTDFSTGLDTSKTLIMGGSQGGMLPYMASTTGLLKVKSIITSVASPEFASSWIENGSIKMSFLWTISYTPDTARYNGQVTAMEKWVYATGQKSAFWDSLATYLPMNRDFKNQVSNITIPILLENSWQDYFFNALGNIRALPNLKNEYKTYFGAVMGHGGDVSNTETIWHMDFFNNWFYKFLWNDSTNYMNIPKYNLAYTSFPISSNMWSFVHDSSNVWPPPNVGNLRFYFVQNNKLSKTKTNSTSSASFVNDVRNKNLTLRQATDMEFTGPTFDSSFKKQSIYFETEPLTTQMKLVGTPSLTLKYSSNANICQYNFQIYEVNSLNEKKLVTRINYTDRKYSTNNTKTLVIPGTSHAHIFQPGSKIRIEVTNFDLTPTDAPFLGTNPYVLPVMVKATNKIYFNASYIDLPVINPIVTDFSTTGTPDGVASEFTLSQNYPNPFNPVTNIRFSLPQNFSGNVSLKIYDITGKEVSVLLNSSLSGGEQNVQWNAVNFASGVYFYKLQAGSFSEVKKMTLLK